MATKINKYDRELILRKVLTEAFEPRFKAVADAIKMEAPKKLEELHPVFVRLLKDPEAAKYLSVNHMHTLYFNEDKKEFKAFVPNYGMYCNMRESIHRNDSDNLKYLKLNGRYEFRTPQNETGVCSTDPATLGAYRKAWADYTEAQAKLSALLNAYTTREKLAEDFPEFAGYLSPIPQKMSLPAVIVADVRAELSKVGVPAKSK